MCNFIRKVDCVACSGHPIFGRVRCREAVPPVYIRESRPKSAIGKRTLPTHRKDLYVS